MKTPPPESQTTTTNPAEPNPPRESARYRETMVPRYDGNPLILALPPILSEADASKRLLNFPPYKESERELPAHVRLHMIQTALEVFIPLRIHTDLEQRFSAMIRNGYVNRNPTTSQHWSQIDNRVRELGSGTRMPVRAAAPGCTIIGLSGAGKSTGAERILNTYAQVIEHTEFKGKRLRATQIVYLKMACPFDGSVKGLCIHFFDEIDRILGTNESRRYVGSRSSVDQLLPSMARLASLLNLGILVIDEIQHLSHNKSGGRERMLNFFVDLVDRIHLPVVLIGTYAAEAVLGDEFRQIRRGCGHGDCVWDRMRNDETWKLFVGGLWRYQYVRHKTPLTDELLNVLFDECQGITDFAVKIFMLAQGRAIKSGREVITPSIIRSVARDSLRTAQPVLRALRLNDIDALRRMKDVAPMSFGSALERVIKTTKCEVPSGQSAAGVPEPEQKKPEIPATHAKAITKAAKTGMLATTAAALDAGVGPHTALTIGKFIRSPSEFLAEAKI